MIIWNEIQKDKERVMRMPLCSKCGARIRWMKTKAGKLMPVEWSAQEYILDDMYGKERVLLNSGEVISCRFPQYDEEATGIGFIPHFARCGKEENNGKR